MATSMESSTSSLAVKTESQLDMLSENLLADVVVTETEACNEDPATLVETLTALSTLMDTLDPEMVLDVVGSKLFPRFSLFDLALRKAHRQELSRVGIVDVLLQETDEWLRELRLLVDRCLIPLDEEETMKRANVSIDSPISDALNVKRGRYTARRADDIRYVRYPIDAERLVANNKENDLDTLDAQLWPITGTQKWTEDDDMDEGDKDLLFDDETHHEEDIEEARKENATPSKRRTVTKRRGRRRPKEEFIEEPMMTNEIEPMSKSRSNRRRIAANAKIELPSSTESLLSPVKSEDQEQEDEGEGEYPCLKCGKILHKHYVKLHEQKCQGISVRHPKYKKLGDEYVCTVDGCNVGHSFSSVYGLRLHFHSCHVTEDERVFACPYCEERFSFRTNRNKHVKQKHEKDFQCNQCGKRFGSKDKLLSHMRTHTGEKPFACDKCDYRAAKKFNLDVHKQTRHNEQSNGKYACELCGKLFQTPGRVRRHMDMIHSDSGGHKRKKSGTTKKNTSQQADINEQRLVSSDQELQQEQDNQPPPQQHFIIAEVPTPLFQKDPQNVSNELAADTVDYITAQLSTHEVISVPYQAL